MNKAALVQPAKDQIKAPEVAIPVEEKNEPVAAQVAMPESKKPVATVAAAKKIASKPTVEKKGVTAKLAKKEAAEKPVLSPAAKTQAKPVKDATVVAKENAAEASKKEKASKEKKLAPKKPKLVRDSFTIPETDYALFATLKQRALTAGVEVKKSEILRAAMLALSTLNDAELVKAIGLIERIKTGRPKK